VPALRVGQPADLVLFDHQGPAPAGCLPAAVDGQEHAPRRSRYARSRPAHGRGRTDGPRRLVRGAGIVAAAARRPGALVLEDGKVLPRVALRRRPKGRRRRARKAPGRGRGRLQHLHDRLPGDPLRSQLCRPDDRHDLPADRQLRRQCGRPRVRPAMGQSAGRAGAGGGSQQLAVGGLGRRAARRCRRPRPHGGRHPEPDAPPPQRRGPAPGSWPRSKIPSIPATPGARPRSRRWWSGAAL